MQTQQCLKMQINASKCLHTPAAPSTLELPQSRENNVRRCLSAQVEHRSQTLLQSQCLGLQTNSVCSEGQCCGPTLIQTS